MLSFSVGVSMEFVFRQSLAQAFKPQSRQIIPISQNTLITLYEVYVVRVIILLSIISFIPAIHKAKTESLY